MTGTELDDILADNGTQDATEQTQTTDTVARDEHGRFAPKAGDPEVVAAIEPAVGAEEPETGNIPPAALAASRQKAREKEQEAEQLRTQLAELRGQVDVLTRQTRQVHQPAPKIEEQKPTPEIWEDPNGFVQAALNPVQKAMQEQMLAFAKDVAVMRHTEEKVTAAEQAFMQAAQNRTLDPADFDRVIGAKNRYSACVDWHQRQQTLSTVGNDPNAWLEAEIEKRLADPAHQGKFLERIQATAAQNTNRSNPVTNLPPSLTRLPSGGNAPGSTDMSDAGLFSHATR